MPSLDDFTRRFWYTLPLTVVVTVLAMGGHRLKLLEPTAQSWVELVLSAPVILWAGSPFFVRGAQSVANRSPNMWTLIGLGVAVAYVYSVVATVAPQVFPESFVEHGRVMFVAVAGQLLGLIAVSDPIKSTTPEAIASLHRDGVRIVMATGDGWTTARWVGKQLGIDEVIGEVKPQDKVGLVTALQADRKRVAMAGDGINDAPALAKADVGIAMGTGTDVAMNAGHVTLVKGDLLGITRARVLSRATVRNMYENLTFALVYNGLGVPIAAGVLYPAFGVLLSPLIAALAMSLSSVSVVGNALRLRRAT